LTRNLITRILAPHFGSNHSSLVAIKCSAFGIGLPNQQIAAAPIENHLIGQGFWGGTIRGGVYGRVCPILGQRIWH